MIIQQNTITAKRAIEVARTYLKSILKVSTILVEEIERTEDGGYWLITLSHDPEIQQGKLSFLEKRKYKVFKISSTTGEVVSMRIRQVR